MSLEVCNLVFKRSTRPRLQQKKQGNSQTKQQRTPNKLMRSNKKRQRLRLHSRLQTKRLPSLRLRETRLPRRRLTPRLRLRLRKRDLNKNLMLPLVLIQSWLQNKRKPNKRNTSQVRLMPESRPSKLNLLRYFNKKLRNSIRWERTMIRRQLPKSKNSKRTSTQAIPNLRLSTSSKEMVKSH